MVAHRRDERGIAADEHLITDGRRIFVEAVVVTGNRACADVALAPDLRVAQVGEVHSLGAFADGAFLQFDKIADTRVRLQMIIRPKAREGPDNHAVIEAALCHDAMRLDRHVVAQDGIVENASGSNRAPRANFCFSEQLHAGLDDRVFARCHIGIDQHGLRQLDCHAGVHQGVALPLAEDAVDLRQLGARVTAKHFAGVRDHLSEDGLAFRGHYTDGVGQIEFAVLVVWFHL